MYKDGCSLCELSDQRSATLRVGIISGKQLPSVVADKYEMTEEEVMDHVYMHGELENVSSSGEVLSVHDYFDELKKILARLNNWIRLLQFTEVPSSEDVRMLTTLTKESREIFKIIGELEEKVGALEREEENIKLREQVMVLTDVMSNEVCSKCKPKVLNRLEKENIL